MKGLFRAVFNKNKRKPKERFHIKYFNIFEKLNHDEKCRIIEEIQIHLQKEYDKYRKLADSEYANTNNEGDWDYRSGYHSEILYDRNRPREISEWLKRYNNN
mgnify:CR=1 FL=1